MRFSTSLCPSPAATCSHSPKPISSPGIYLPAFPSISLPLSTHPMTTASCPNERSRELSPGPSAPFSRRNHYHRIHNTYTERISDRAILSCRCVLLLDTCTHVRTHTTRDRAVDFSQGGSTRTMRRTAAVTTTMAHAKASRRRYETGGYLFPCYMGTLSLA